LKTGGGWQNKAILLLVIFAVFYALIFFLSDIDKIAISLSKINFQYYIIIFPLILGSIFVRGIRFHILLLKLDIVLKKRESVLISTAGLAMLFTPGGFGTILKSYILKQKIGQSYSVTTPILIYEKWIELIATTIAVGVLLTWANLYESKIIFAVGLALSVLIFLIMKKNRWLGLFNKLIYKIGLGEKLSLDEKEFQRSCVKLLSFGLLVKLLSLALFNRIIILITVFLIFESFHLNINLFLSGQLFFTSILIGALSFMPQGAVVFDTSMLGMLVSNGIDFSVASVLILVIRSVILWFPVLLGFICLKIVLDNKWQKQNNSE